MKTFRIVEKIAMHLNENEYFRFIRCTTSKKFCKCLKNTLVEDIYHDFTNVILATPLGNIYLVKPTEVILVKQFD